MDHIEYMLRHDEARRKRILGVMDTYKMSFEDAENYINEMDAEKFSEWNEGQKPRDIAKEEHEDWLEKHVGPKEDKE